MLKATTTINKGDRIMRGEAPASRHNNIVGHYDDETLIDKSGKLIKIIKLGGVDFITKDDITLDIYKNRRNSLLKSFTSEYALYFWTIRHKTAEFPAGDFEQPFAQQVNEKYKAKIEHTEMYNNALYVAIVTKPPEGVINKSLNVFKLLSQRADKNAKNEYLKKRHKELNDITRKVLNSLSDYQPELLNTFEKKGIYFSKPLEFISHLINFDKHTIPLTIKDAASYLVLKRLFFNRRSGTIEMRAGDNSKKFAAVLSIKEYEPITYQGLLDDLNHLRIEYVITQSFRFYDRHDSKSRLRDQQKDMVQSKDESVSQTAQIDEAVDEAASGEVGYGAHHFTLVCYADTQEELNKHVGEIIAKFSDLDIICVREDVACECGFWAQLPGNFSYIARQATISTKNMASFASLHNFATGKIKNNYWGDAVTVFETLAGSPYYFNFHYKDVGNFIVVGAMGSGKTVLVGFLIVQSMKFGGKRIIFDKDRGLEILVRALGGVYEVIKSGIATGLNPCQLDDTPENRSFLSNLFVKILKPHDRPINEAEIKIIEDSIDGMYRLNKEDRQFHNIAPFFGTKKEGSLRARFEQWHSKGKYAWLFDNAIDSFNYEADVIGIDLGSILQDEVCKTPALMYLMFRFGHIMEGQRGLIFIDEGWLALSDEYFKDVINDLSRTPRKKNNIFGLATQSANDTASTAISAPINEAAACKIFFPNPTAKYKVYVTEYGLTDHEYHLIKTLPDDQHFFLLNFGKGKESVVIRANLAGMEDEIAVISGREETIRLLDKIRTEVGDDPNVWLPIFQTRRKNKEALL